MDAYLHIPVVLAAYTLDIESSTIDPGLFINYPPILFIPDLSIDESAHVRSNFSSPLSSPLMSLEFI